MSESTAPASGGMRSRIGAVPAVELVALAAAIAPIVVTVVRAATNDWMPLYDAGYFAVRSRDVLTDHHPLLGAWSMGSRTVGETLNNLGPMQLDLLAPFTKIWPYWGTALGVGLVNIAAVVGVWFAARRLLGRVGVVGAMLATVCLYAAMGSWNLIEARQQLALLLPFWCLLWLTAAIVTGAWWALPWTVLVASFIAQTHFSYVYQTLALVVTGGVALTVTWWRERPRPPVGRPLVVAGTVAVVCWGQTLWDEAFGVGNMSTVLRQGGGASEAAGWSKGVRFVADSTLMPPFWLPGHMGEYLRPDVVVSTGRAAAVVIAWVVSMVAAVVVGRLRHHRVLVALGIVSIVALASGCYAAAAIPDTEFGFVPYNYYWMWPIGLLLTATAIAAVVTIAPVRQRIPARAVSYAVGAVCVLVAVTVFRPVNELPETVDEPDAGGRVGEPLMERFGASLDRLGIEGPVVIDRSRETRTNYFPYTMLIELQRRGIEYTFPPGDVNLARFGNERCETGSAAARLILADGPLATFVEDGQQVIAEVDGLAPAEAAELTALDEAFGDRLRDGSVAVDVDGFEFFGWEPSPTLLDVLADPSMPANGLAQYLSDWRVFDVVTVPPEHDEQFRRWRDLEERSIFDRVAIILGPNLVTTDTCTS